MPPNSELWPQILSALPDGVFVVGSDGRVSYANEQVLELLGYAAGALEGLDAGDLAWGPGGAAVMQAALEQVRGSALTSTSGEFHAVVPAKRADGQRIDVEVWARATGDLVVWTVRAPTATPAESSSDSSFRALLDQLPDAIGVHRGGRFVYANTAAARLYGVESPAALVGTPILEVVHPDDRAAVAERLARLAGGAPHVPMQEERIVRRDGSVVTALVSGVRVEFEGQPAVVALARDLAEQRRVQAQLALADRMASVGALAAGVAHEINNPLTYVMLRLDALSALGRRFRGRLADVEKRLSHRLGERDAHEVMHATLPQLVDDLDVHVRGAAEGVDRVRRIVGDLRVFARADDEPLQPTDVKHALDVALGMAMHELRHRARILRDEQPVRPVLASEGKLVQVFLNLFVNAGQAIGSDEPSKNEVRIGLAERGGLVSITVADSGCGIAPENLPHLFEPFFTTKPAGSGTGLGLAVCHGIVTSLGGTIRAESQVGEGSCFTVELPVVEASASRAPSSPPHKVGSQTLRVLIVDDEAPIGRALRAALADLGEVVVVASAPEAIEELGREPAYDLVLTDVRMPGMSGLELFRWIGANRPDLARRVLLMTGGRLSPEELAVAESNPRRWLEKPFDLRELRERIEAILAGDDGDGPPEAA